jgi:hypothetical protein
VFIISNGDALLKIVSNLKEFPQRERGYVVQLINQKEWGRAFERICQVIRRERVHIPWETYEQIITIGTHMELDPYEWEETLLYVN